MSSQNKLPDDDKSKKEFINGAWVDVKLCTVRAKKRRQQLSAIETKNKSTTPETQDKSAHNYNDLHYGNYE